MTAINKCILRGNALIECFGQVTGWWVGCKPCSRGDNGGGQEHAHAMTREAAIAMWNGANPIGEGEKI